MTDHEDRYWLEKAIDLSRSCPPSETAFSVGAIIVDARQIISTGYSRETDPHDHAEEVAISKLQAGDPRPPRSTAPSNPAASTSVSSQAEPQSASEFF